MTRVRKTVRFYTLFHVTRRRIRRGDRLPESRIANRDQHEHKTGSLNILILISDAASSIFECHLSSVAHTPAPPAATATARTSPTAKQEGGSRTTQNWNRESRLPADFKSVVTSSSHVLPRVDFLIRPSRANAQRTDRKWGLPWHRPVRGPFCLLCSRRAEKRVTSPRCIIIAVASRAKVLLGKIHLPSNNIFRYSFYSTLKSSHKGTFISILPNPTGQLIAINFLIVEPCSRSATTDQRYDKKVRNVTKRFDRFQVKQSDGTKRRSRRLVSWSAKRRRYLRRRKRRRIRFDLLHEQRPRPRLYDCPNPAVGFTVVKPRP